MADGNGSLPYSVKFSQSLLDQLRVWAEEAKRLGAGAEFLEAVRQMSRRLKTNPTKWGDPLWEYQTINAAELRGMIPKWVLVWYGVNDSARQVIVRRLLPAPGSPLTPPPTIPD